MRPVVPGGAGAPDFEKSVNPISTKGGILCPPNNTGTTGFSDLPTALVLNIANSKSILFITILYHIVFTLSTKKKPYFEHGVVL